ncbi:hypothetical protein I4U23_017326 [Adineta vaga]|nr:hypothetical protein I4U23_017326 [Adineta vaga]
MMQRCWIFLCISIAILVANSHAEDLRVNVFPIQSRFAFVQNVSVILRYSNTGSDTISIHKWFLPERMLSEQLFEVTRDGQAVEYVGPIVKRGAPNPEDIIILTPGMEVSSVVELSSVYNMTESGNYVIQYKMDADQVLFTTDSATKNRMALLNDAREHVIQSDPVVVFAVGRRNQLIEESVRYNTQARALTPTFIGCSASRSTAISSAMRAAESYNSNALQYLNTLSLGTTRYTTWFGTFSPNNRGILQTHFTKIRSALGTKTVSFDCTCPDSSLQSAYAYVYPSRPYTVYLCNAYWNAPATGTDSKSGTIIHELAHFTVLAGTDDYGYGQAKCKTLAQSSPAKAIMNSDSLQYFAENNPHLS